MWRKSLSALEWLKRPGVFGALLILSIVGVRTDDAVDFQNNLPARVVWAVSGRDAELPCNVTPPDPGDRVNIVFWFKDTTGVPLYSLDARDGDLDRADHTAISTDLGGRAYFQTAGFRTASLRVKNVSIHDEGVFRCRIDFLNSPTINFLINLTIIEMPSTPIIYDANGREVTAMAGPFREGYDMFLYCNVTGGRPRPEVIWRHGGLILGGSVDYVSELITINRLYIATVPRSFWNTHMECRARSSNLTEAVVRRVPLDIYLKPRKVQMVTEDILLSAGKPHIYKCESAGSVPPAVITWLLDGKPIREHDILTTKGINTTSSTLTFRPQASDDGREIACRAENLRFTGGILEDRRRLHVAYAPVVSVQLETNAAQAPLKEGDKVRLSCEVNAKPEPDRITWFHRGGLLDYNETSGVLPDDRTLKLRAITREMAGDYLCAAANREGETRSSSIRIRVQYAPRCRTGFAVRRTGAVMYRKVTVRCEVDADPGGDDVKFHWTIERGREVIRVPSTWVKSKGLGSDLEYEPKTEDDFGTLACYATNSVGRQEQPCLFHVVPARAPQPPGQCMLRNLSSGRLEVACEAGSDGDLPQHFVLEVSEAPTTLPPPASVSTLNDQGGPSLPLGPTLYRNLGAEPRFVLHSLEPGRDYQLAVYAENAKGRSEPPVIIPSVRVSTAMQKLTGTDEHEDIEVASPQPMAIILGVLLSAAVLILAAIFTTVALVTCRRRAALAELQRQVSGPVTATESRRSMYSEEEEEEVELDIAAGFRSGPRVRFCPNDEETWSSVIEDEGGGGAIGRRGLREPDLLSRVEVSPDSAVIPSASKSLELKTPEHSQVKYQ